MNGFQAWRSLAAGAVLVVSAAGPVWAADPATDAIQRAYGPYRVALFKTNSKSQADAEQAMAQAQAAWQQVVQAFSARPPAPYDRDTRFGASLQDVAQVYDRAAQQVADKQLAEAHETLEQARDILSELRRRNQVVVYSDHMNAFHAEMEHVLEDGGKTLEAAQGMQRMAARAGVLAYLAARLRTEAPQDLSSNGEFKALLEGLEVAVQRFFEAVVAQDVAATKQALGGLKVPYSKMFLKFG